jgi:drug/metabolite transporter (DMT)-like permease
MGTLALFAGSRNAAFSVAGPVGAIGSAGFSVLAGLLLGERPGTLAIAGIGLALPAIVGVSASPAGSGQGGPGHPSAGVTWGLLAGARFAVLVIALNRAGAGNGLWTTAAAKVTALVAATCLGVATGQARLPPRRATGRRL